MSIEVRPLAVVTGASTGIGFELAKCCAESGFDLAIAADEPEVRTAAERLTASGASVQAVEADLATAEGVDRLYAATQGRPVAALLANAGRGLGRAFLDQDFSDIRQVIDTNVTGTLYLIQKVGRDMRSRGEGRAELKDSGVTVTCLMPGATETEFFERADMLDTKVGTQKKQAADEVAKVGFEAMMKGQGDVVAGWQNKLQAAIAHLMPAGMVAEQHRRMAAPGTASKV